MLWLCAAWTAVSLGAAGQQIPKVTLESSETLFSALAALNACGYDQELASSDPVRIAVRAEMARAIASSHDAATARDQVCAFYRDHRQNDPGKDLAQYVSLALNLGAPPAFEPVLKESDLPPDAAYVLGFVPLLQKFYTAAGLHGIWLRHEAEYEALIARFQKSVTDMMLATEYYLKLPLSSAVEHRFGIYLEPLAGPGQINARNYGSDYFLVVSPEGRALPMAEIRHSYLHYLLDPLALRRGQAMDRLRPLLAAVQAAPMAESYKRDVSLLVTESLIRAIEARTLADGKSAQPGKTRLAAASSGTAAEAQKRALVQADMEEGFILTGRFYDELEEFEKGPEGLRTVYSDLLRTIDVGRERKRAQALIFRRQAAPEVVHASKKPPDLLDEAEDRLGAGDLESARQKAEQALSREGTDHSRALFILARVATLNRDMPGARSYFQRTLEVARAPRIIAWSHIYLARMFDLEGERQQALQHYRAALAAGDFNPGTRAAAQRGLKQPYEPPAARGVPAPSRQQ